MSPWRRHDRGQRRAVGATHSEPVAPTEAPLAIPEPVKPLTGPEAARPGNPLAIPLSVTGVVVVVFGSVLGLLHMGFSPELAVAITAGTGVVAAHLVNCLLGRSRPPQLPDYRQLDGK